MNVFPTSSPTPAEIVQRGADLLVPALRRFVEDTAPHSGVTWEQYYAARDTRDGRTPRKRSLDDPRFLLNIVTHEWRAFSPNIEPMHSAWARELTMSLNRAAHARQEFSDAEARRFLDTLGLFCESLLPDADLGPRIRELNTTLERPAAAPNSQAPAISTPAEAPATAAEAVTSTPPEEVTLPSDAEASTLKESPILETEPESGTSSWDDVDDRDDLGEGLRRVQLRVGEISVEAIYSETLSFAQVCQGAHPVVEISWSNDGTDDAKIDLLTVEIEGLALDPGAAQLTDIDLPAGSGMTLGSADIAWKPERRSFAEVTLATPVDLRVSMISGGRPHSGSGKMTVLARDQWAFEPRPELISAFVAPNDPGVSDIVEKARGRVAPEANDAMAMGDAIYAELASRGLRHEAGTAAPDTGAFSVRRPEQTLQNHGGTGLDLAVLFASALEAAGINPLITLTDDGGFGGYLTADFALSEPAVTDEEMIHTLARSQYLVPVDLGVFERGADVPRREATAATESYWERGLDRVRAVIDVAAARRRIEPLPRLRTDANGLLILEVEQAAPLALRLNESWTGTTATAAATAYPRRVQNWRSALLDLSFRNPLLKLSGRSGLGLHVPERSLPTFEDILASGESLTIRAGLGLDPLSHGGATSVRDRDEAAVESILFRERVIHGLMTEDSLGTRLDKLRRDAQRVIEETGSNSLFVTIGALKWSDARGNDAYAPLYLLPVKLQGRTKGTYKLVREGDEVALPNYCLIQKLKLDHGIDIPALETPPRDDAGIDVPRVLTAIRQALVSHGLPFAVVSDVRLAILQFSTLEMWRDVSDNWETHANNPVVKHLIETPHDTFGDAVDEPQMTQATEAEEHLPVPADGSQLEAIRWARAGRTFVLEGPPGTGKSQTITNIIANCLADGQSVLFVAEKPAALEVVRRRLKGAGLGALTLDLHGKDLTVSSVRKQLRDAWEYVPRDDARYVQSRSKARSLVEELAAYPLSLHSAGPAGLSLWQAQAAVLRHAGSERAPVTIPATILRGEVRIEDALDHVSRAEERLSELDRPLSESPWGLAGPGAAPLDTDAVSRAVAALHSAALQLSPALVALLRATGQSGWGRVPGLLATLSSLPENLVDEASRHDASWSTQLQHLAGEMDRFAAHYGHFASVITAPAHHADVPRLREELNAAHAAGVFKRKRLVENAEANIAALMRPDLARPHDLRAFLNDLEHFQGEANNLRRRSEALLPGGGNPHMGGQIPRQMAAYLEQLRVARGSFENPQALETYVDNLRRRATDPRRDFEALEPFTLAWSRLRESLMADEDTINTWCKGRGLAAAVLDTLPAWQEAAQTHRFGELRRVAAAQGSLAELRRIGLDGLIERLERGDDGRANVRDAVDAEIADAVRAERLDSAGLERFNAKRRMQRIEEFARESDSARKAAPTALPALVRQAHAVDTRRPSKDLAALHREFERKRGGSIRELLAQHSPALRRLTPCLLMSPANVARFVPADVEPFDLVIFDEASQIRVADAVGALGRAKAAIVVGDSEQMPPTSMFAVSNSDKDDDSATEEDLLVPSDQESILSECVDSNIRRLWLTWHYRSQDESLITFSNHAYYHDRLASFPAPPSDSGERAVSMKLVRGQFDGGVGGTRTNKVEATAILEEVKELLRRDPSTSIGIVTLNSQQRDLLTEMFEEEEGAVRRAMNRDEDPLFVKNLENVQGDERDVILFSLAFSPNEKTNRLGLNFGPLTRTGGHHRLNVAITRARKKVKLFASFQPEDIDLSRTRSVGLHDLRAYMEFARGDESAVEGAIARLAPDAYRRSLVEALTKSGLEVREGVGTSSFKVDLAVRRPGSEAWVALLLDGKEWAERATVSDREVLPEMVLGKVMQWPRVERVWLPEWIADEAGVLARIDEACADASAKLAESRVESAEVSADEVNTVLHEELDLHTGEGAPTTNSFEPSQPAVLDAPLTRMHTAMSARLDEVGELTVAPPESVAPELSEGSDIEPDEHTYSASDGPSEFPQSSFASTDDEEPNTEAGSADEILLEEFIPWETETLEEGLLSDLTEPHAKARVRETVRRVVAAEGPIESWRLATIVGRSYGVQRVSSLRHGSVLNLVPRTQARAENGLTFVWPEDVTPDAYNLVRQSSVPHRSVTEISRAELTNAMILALSEYPAMSVPALHRATMRTFGISRLGSNVQSRLEAVLAWAVRNGWIVKDGHLCALPEE
ncbi:DUF4011 domain-containing protein [Dermacoccus sp. 147Ba]|nr:DUF4011 domain-containing protein [Dermacoccus sp. 147Ba]